MLKHYSPYEKVNEKELITSIYFTFPTFGNHYHLLLTQFLLGTCRVSAAKLKEGIKNPLKKKSYLQSHPHFFQPLAHWNINT